jgi:uncharacterized membrane protein
LPASPTASNHHHQRHHCQQQNVFILVIIIIIIVVLVTIVIIGVAMSLSPTARVTAGRLAAMDSTSGIASPVADAAGLLLVAYEACTP